MKLNARKEIHSVLSEYDKCLVLSSPCRELHTPDLQNGVAKAPLSPENVFIRFERVSRYIPAGDLL